jgi:hypothetical protein
MHELEPQPAICPTCGESIEILVDASAGEQRYVEDCEVCCCPFVVSVFKGEVGEFDVSVSPENGV